MKSFWQIVPINDGYTYLCMDNNKKYFLKEKAKELMFEGKLFFNTQEEAQNFIDINLDSSIYKAENFWINDDYYDKKLLKSLQKGC